jgi:hypothetical protein
MPSQLLTNLRKFLDQGSGQPQDQAASTHPLDMVMRHETTNRADVLVTPTSNPAKPGEPALNHTPHWRENSTFGNKMAKNTVATSGINNVSGVNTISIHETTGWPSYAGVENMVRRHLCIAPYNEWVATATPPHWVTQETGKKGVGPQYYIDANGTVFALIGEFDFGDEPRITIHTETVNSTSIGIENGDAGDAGIRPADNASGPYWFRLNPPTAANPDDQPGLAAFALLHPHSAQADLNLIWFSTTARGAAIPNYPGSGDTSNIATRYPHWDNMIFTERDYRSLALLVRLLFEKYGVPRNFCILPWSKVDADGSLRDTLRKIILADERQDMMARKFGIAITDIQNRTNAWTSQNNQTLWFRFFGVLPSAGPAPELPTYRGVIGHAMVGAHPCPGPLFDWHRFSREVWDWWWYPFDLNIFSPALFPPRRQYMQARGDTSLQEHYYDAAEPGTDFTTIGARFDALGVPALDTARGANHFALEASTPAYAMANGVLVAARIANPADPANPPLVLIRHEVFNQADPTTNSIDYDHPPAIVWTLTTYLNSSAFNFTRITTDNPDWLNRMLIRLTECELAVSYKAAHPGDNPTSPQYNGNPTLFANDQRFQTAWNFPPTSTGPRPTTGDNIQNDATEYRRIVNALQTGGYVLFPLESAANTTPVRVILGDFLGPCGTLSNNSTGIQVQIFSKTLLIPNSPQQALFWTSQQWWADSSSPARLDGTPDKCPPGNGVVYSYPVTAFLDWINQITWKSEWPKYEVVDAAGASVATPERPRTRIGI